jgi:hypothetical protein
VRAAGDADLSVGAANVRLDGIRAEVGQHTDLAIGLALGDEARISLSRSLRPSERPGQSWPTEKTAIGRRWADDDLARVDPLQSVDELACGKCCFARHV